jgi:protein TonB
VQRGLPYSLVLHGVLALLLVLVGGNVPAPALQPQQLIKVRLADLPREEPPQLPPESVAQEQEPADEPEAQPEPEPPPPEPRRTPEPEPTDVVEQPEEKPEPDRERPLRQPEPEPLVEPGPAEPQPLVAGQDIAVSATDQPFPFPVYLQIVRQRITREWNPPQAGRRSGGEWSSVVHFTIERSGQITRPNLVARSGISLLDREALRAVQSANPLPPLPAEFPSRALGITFVFTLKPNQGAP